MATDNNPETSAIVSAPSATAEVDAQASSALIPQSDEGRLEELKAERDRHQERRARRLSPEHEDFIPFRDCDAVLEAGSILKLGGVEVKLLMAVPVQAPELRDEQTFVEHLAQEDPRNLAVNAKQFRSVYNANGRLIGRNDKHPANWLDDEIARLEGVIAAKAKEKEAAEKAE